MKALGFVLTVGVVLGQPMRWEQQMTDGACWESAGRSGKREPPINSP